MAVAAGEVQEAESLAAVCTGGMMPESAPLSAHDVCLVLDSECSVHASDDAPLQSGQVGASAHSSFVNSTPASPLPIPEVCLIQ